MRANQNHIQNNLNAHDIEGEFDLSAAAAVVAQADGRTCRGDSCTVTKTGTGTYVVRVRGMDQGMPAVYEKLNRHANFSDGTPATALAVRMTTVTVDNTQATRGDILITIITSATVGGAAADGTSAVTVSFRVKIRTNRVY